MPRDYKGKGSGGRRKSGKKSASTSDASPLKLLLAGFSAGVVAAAVAYYALTPAPPSRSGATPAPAAQPRSIAEEEDVSVGSAAPAARAPAPRTARTTTVTETEADDADKNKYPFWRWLENYEVIIPEDNERLEPTTPVEAVTREGTYYLQVGAFNRYADADRLKAQLALSGIETHIQRVTLDDREIHRVRIGPETSTDRVNALRRELAQQSIDVMVIRMAR